MLSRTSFESLLRKDEMPETGSPLKKQFEKNPKLLLGEVNYPRGPLHSVVALAITLGKLNLADCILKPDNNNFALKADSFYLGKDYLNLDRLPKSAGINFYLALITWQFHFQKNEMSKLINETNIEEITIKKPTRC